MAECTQAALSRCIQYRFERAQIGTEYNGSAQLEYIQPLSNNMVWFTQLDYNFTDDYFMSGDRDPVQIQSGFGTLNARTGLRTDNWMLMAYGRNLTDELISTGRLK